MFRFQLQDHEDDKDDYDDDGDDDNDNHDVHVFSGFRGVLCMPAVEGSTPACLWYLRAPHPLPWISRGEEP